MTGDEAARGVQSFNKFVGAFIKASSEGSIEKLLDETEYLAPACLAMANAFIETVVYGKNVQLQQADSLKFGAAAYLVNAATKMQGAKPQ